MELKQAIIKKIKLLNGDNLSKHLVLKTIEEADQELKKKKEDAPAKTKK